MSSPRLVIGYVKLKAVPQYTCSTCGRLGIGSTVTVECSGVELLGRDLEKVVPPSISNSHMPTGWAGFGRGDVRCPLCAGA